jgi:hypothetical protein
LCGIDVNENKEYNCPKSLLYNPYVQACDIAQNVVCKRYNYKFLELASIHNILTTIISKTTKTEIKTSTILPTTAAKVTTKERSEDLIQNLNITTELLNNSTNVELTFEMMLNQTNDWDYDLNNSSNLTTFNNYTIKPLLIDNNNITNITIKNSSNDNNNDNNNNILTSKMQQIELNSLDYVKNIFRKKLTKDYLYNNSFRFLRKFFFNDNNNIKTTDPTNTDQIDLREDELI